MALKRAAKDKKNWTDRPKDVSFVISSLPDIEAKTPGLRGKVDFARIGVAGHSFGAYTAMATAGAKPDLESHLTDLRDDRPIAFIALSPQGEAEFVGL